MNYFELFELPVLFVVDKAALKKKFFALSRQFHPDYFAQQDAAAQQHALEQTALINQGFKVLSDTDATIKYVLELKGLLIENEKYELPPAFLMDMLELNEAMEDANSDPNQQATVLKEINDLEATLYEPVQNLVTHYDDTASPAADLEPVKAYYFKKKYLQRLKQQLNEM